MYAIPMMKGRCQSHCAIFPRVDVSVAVFQSAVSQFIVSIRTWAISGRSKTTFWILVVALLLSITVSLIATILPILLNADSSPAVGSLVECVQACR